MAEDSPLHDALVGVCAAARIAMDAAQPEDALRLKQLNDRPC